MHYHGHRKRLRARLTDASEKLADYEILELLLGYVLVRRDTKPIAKEMLARFGSIRGVVEARPEQYLDIEGIGQGVVDFMRLLSEFLPRYAESKVRTREILCDPESVAAMARERLRGLSHEEIWIAYVDNRNRLIVWEKVSRGTVDAAVINTREIVERGLLLKAKGFILVHNHPGGDPHPSGLDVEFTRRLDSAASMVYLRFVDHVVVTDDKCYSIKRDGLL